MKITYNSYLSQYVILLNVVLSFCFHFMNEVVHIIMLNGRGSPRPSFFECVSVSHPDPVPVL